MRSFLRLFAIAGLAAGSLAAHASPVTYGLTLTPNAGSSYGGSGSFTLAAPFVNNTAYYTTNGLQALSFTIDNQTFNLAGETSGNLSHTFVEFQTNNLYDITFAETVGAGLQSLTLDTSGNYAFYYYVNGAQAESSGTFSLTPVTSPTPEPGSLVLLATGLLCGIGFLSHRRWLQQS